MSTTTDLSSFVTLGCPEPARFADLLAFARLEVESGDLEPWAALLRELCKNSMRCDAETTLWLVKLYNAFDSISSAWGCYRRWKHPLEFHVSPTELKWTVTQFYHTLERRNLRGGRVILSFDSYCDLFTGHDKAAGTQESWLREPLLSDQAVNFNFLRLFEHVQKVWGVGRLAAFEWVEFLEKVCDFPLAAPDAVLWNSSGPRESLEKLYGLTEPSPAQLDRVAGHCRDWLTLEGVALSWEDFETVICDFNVMRKGRYYPGRHLAALRGEIEEVLDSSKSRLLQSQADHDLLLAAFRAITPEPWRDIPPFINKELMPKYRDTGKIHLPVSL